MAPTLKVQLEEEQAKTKRLQEELEGLRKSSAESERLLQESRKSAEESAEKFRLFVSQSETESQELTEKREVSREEHQKSCCAERALQQ